MAIMDILVRARDQASRTFRNIERASEQAERALKSLGATYDRIERQMKRGLAFDVDTKTFESKLDSAERKVKTVRDKILKYLNDIRSAAGRGAEFEIRVSGERELQQTADRIKRIAEQVDGLEATVEFGEKGSDTLKRTVRDVLEALGDLDGKTATANIALDGEKQLKSALESAERSLKAFDGKEYTATLGLKGSESVSRAAKQAEDRVKDFDGLNAAATVALDGAKAVTDDLDRVRDALDRFDGTDSKASVSLDGAEGIRKTLSSVLDALDKFDGQKFVATVELRGAKEVTDSASDIGDRLNRLDRIRAAAEVALEGAQDAIRSAERVEDVTERLDRIQADAQIGLDGAERVRQTVEDITETVEDYSDLRPTTTAAFDSRKATADMRGYNETIRRYARSWGKQGIRTRVVADINQAQRRIAQLEGILEDLTDEEERIVVTAEVERARGNLRGLQVLAAELDIQNPEINVEVRGVLSSTAALLGLNALADRLDGYQISMGAGVDSSLSEALPNLLGALELQLGRLQTVQMAVAATAMPLMLTRFAAMPAVMSVAAGSVFSLVIALGQGFVGAAGQAGGAAVLAAGSFGIFGAAMIDAYRHSLSLTDTLSAQFDQIDAAKDNLKQAESALAGLTEGTEAYEGALRGVELAQAQLNHEEALHEEMLASVGPKQLALVKATQRTELAMVRFKGALREQVAPSLVLLISTIGKFGPAIQRGMLSMIGDMSRFFDVFVKSMSAGQNLKNLTAVFRAFGRSGVASVRSILSILQILISVLAVVLPDSVELLRTFSRLAKAAADWTSSAEGQERIGEVWALLKNRADQLWRIVKNVTVGLYGLYKAIEEAGIGDHLMGRLVAISREFRTMMGAGSDARAGVTKFFEGAKPILVSLESLARTAGSAFLELANKVMGADMPDGTPVLVEIIQAVEDAVVPIMELLAHEFEDIGPLLPGLIRQLAEYFGLFAAATPEMVIFLKAFTGVLTAFNDLPDGVQIGIARIMAYSFAIKSLGGGAMLGLISSIASTIFWWKKLNDISAALNKDGPKKVSLFTKIANAAKSVGNALKSAGTAIAGFATKLAKGIGPAISRVIGMVSKIGPALKNLGPMISRIGPAVLRVVAAFGRLTLVRTAIQGVIMAFGAIAGAVSLPVIAVVAAVAAIVAAGVLVWRKWDWVMRQFDRLPNWLERIVLGMIAPFMVLVTTIGGLITGDWSKLLEYFTRVTGIKAKTWGDFWQKAKDRVVFIWRLLKATVTKTTQDAVTAVTNAWKRLSTSVGNILTGVKNRAVAIWRGVREGIVNVVASLVVGVGNKFEQFKTFVANAWRNISVRSRIAWVSLKQKIVATAAALVQGVIEKVSTLRERISGVFERVRESAQNVWQSLVKFVTNAAARIVTGVSNRWNSLREKTASAFQRIRDAISNIWQSVTKAVSNAVGRLVTGIVNRWNQLRERTSSAFQKLREMLSSIWQSITKAVSNAVGRVVTAVVNRWNQLRERTSSAFQKLREIVSNVWQSVSKTVSNTVSRIVTGVVNRWNQLRERTSEAFQRLREMMSNLWQAITKTVSGAVTRLVTGVINRWNGLREKTSSVFQRIKEIVVGIWQTVSRSVSNAVGRVVTAVLNKWDQLRERTSSAFQRIRDVIGNVWQSVSKTVSNAVGRIVTAVLNKWEQLRERTSSAFQRVRDIVVNVWQSLLKTVSSAAERIVTAVVNRWNSLREKTASVFARVRQTVADAWVRIREAISDAISKIVSFVSDKWDVLRDRTASALQRIREAIESAWERIRSTVTAATNRVVDFVVDKWNVLRDRTIDAFERIRNAVETAWTKIKTTISNATQAIFDRVSERFIALRDRVGEIFARVVQILEDAWDRVNETTRRVLQSLVEWVVQKWTNLRTRTIEAFDNMRDAVVDRVEDLREKALRAANMLREKLLESWQALPEKAREIFGRVVGNVVEKLQEGINKARSWLGTLLIAVANVADAVGLDSLGTASRTAGEKLKEPMKLAKGGVVQGGTKMYAKGGISKATSMFARGGCSCGGNHGGASHSAAKMISSATPQTPVGGVSDGMRPRAVYGEQKRHVREYYIVPDRTDNVKYLRGAAHDMGYQVVGPGDMHGAPVPQRISQTFLYETGGRYSGAGMWGIPGGVVSTTYGTMRDYGAHMATDVAAPDGTPIHAIYKGVVSAVGSGDTPHNIWADYGGLGAFYGHNSAIEKTGPVNPGDVIARVGNLGFSTGPHAHISVDTTAGGAMKGMWDGSVNPDQLFGSGYVPSDDYTAVSGSGGSSSPGLTMRQMLVELAKGAKAMAKIVLNPPDMNMGIVSDVVTGLVKGLPGKILGIIRKQAVKLVTSAVGGDSGGDAAQTAFPGSADQKKVALWMAKNATGRGMPGRLPVMTALQESGMRNLSYGDRDSVGYFQQRTSQGWGTLDQLQDPEYALDKFLDAAEPYKGQFSNTPTGLGDWAQEVQRSGFPDAYAKWYDAAADLIGDSAYYSRGGIVPGPVGQQVIMKAHAGERVLPRELVRSFDRYADVIQKANRSGHVAAQERAHRMDERRWRERVRPKSGGRTSDGASTNRVGTMTINIKNEVRADGASKEDLDRAMDRLTEKQKRSIRDEVIRAIAELEGDGDQYADRTAGDYL